MTGLISMRESRILSRVCLRLNWITWPHNDAGGRDHQLRVGTGQLNWAGKVGGETGRREQGMGYFAKLALDAILQAGGVIKAGPRVRWCLGRVLREAPCGEK